MAKHDEEETPRVLRGWLSLAFKQHTMANLTIELPTSQEIIGETAQSARVGIGEGGRKGGLCTSPFQLTKNVGQAADVSTKLHAGNMIVARKTSGSKSLRQFNAFDTLNA